VQLVSLMEHQNRGGFQPGLILSLDIA